MAAHGTLTLGEAWTRALAAHRAGDLERAAALCNAIVRTKPDHFEALHLLGVVTFQRGRGEEAVNLFDRALAIVPQHAGALTNRGSALATVNRLEEALASYDGALRVAPDYPGALAGRGNALHVLDRHEEALASYDRALAVDPDDPETLNDRGVTLAALGRHLDALGSYDRALVLRPDYADALINRGNALRALERHAEALATYDRALEVRPPAAETLCSRGDALRALKREAEALSSYDRALAIRPDSPEALVSRGNALRALNRAPEALASYDRALAIRPDFAVALASRANALSVLRRYDEALAGYDQALAIDPRDAHALANRAKLLLDLARHEDALDCYRQALAIKPDPVFHTNLIFALNFVAAASAADHQAERARWHEVHARPLARLIRAHRNDPDPDRRLRVGYVSSHFRHQAATYSFGGVILGHDPARFEVVCYSDTAERDGVTDLLRERVHQWHDTAGLSDDALAELVRSDGIDILVDLVGHMSGHRLLVFARKPAPVQVTGWGEPTGTGLAAMDYLLADPVLVPADERVLLTERVYDLPNFLGYWTPDPLPEPGPLPAIAAGFVTFGSFNRIAKIQDSVLRCWAAILRALPAARLVLKASLPLTGSGQRERVAAVLRGEGIGMERVTLLDDSDRAGHFAAYQTIDVALDPFPHGGGMTTLDALWMGVPVVTWRGRTISSRLAAASLTALGLVDLIAHDRESYVGLAIEQARDLSALARLRADLRARVAGSVIGNPQRYAHAVESAYRTMWRDWCASGRDYSAS